MLSTMQIQNAYQNSGLDSYPDLHWVRLSSQERWIQIEELIKSLYIMHTEFPDLIIPPALAELNQVWQKQTDAINQLYQALNLSPLNKKSKSDNPQLFISKEEKNKANARQAAEILTYYVNNFGNFESSRIQYWPAAGYIMERYYYDLIELNDWLNWYCQLPKLRKRLVREVVSADISDMALVA